MLEKTLGRENYASEDQDRGYWCPSSFHSLYPWILVMQSGGSFSFQEDKDVMTVGCPDYTHQVVYKITRTEVPS
ncbi:MAG: TIGR04076 family protein [Candidatus Thorarchaeota archaeon]|jgi:uncharacterized repeat protein (TIGR04076 family)